MNFGVKTPFDRYSFYGIRMGGGKCLTPLSRNSKNTNISFTILRRCTSLIGIFDLVLIQSAAGTSVSSSRGRFGGLKDAGMILSLLTLS